MTNIAIFASGTGSNARKIIEHFKGHDTIRVALVVSNKSSAPVLAMAEGHNIPIMRLKKAVFQQNEEILEIFNRYSIDFIALAGFLLLIPPYLIGAYQNHILNIHPSLLPKFGGKGMYGIKVHQAVREAKERETGMTIHFVNEHYDEGNILFQATCAITEDDSAEAIAAKVLKLEHEHYPKVIEQLISSRTKS